MRGLDAQYWFIKFQLDRSPVFVRVLASALRCKWRSTVSFSTTSGRFLSKRNISGDGLLAARDGAVIDSTVVGTLSSKEMGRREDPRPRWPFAGWRRGAW